MNWTHWHLATNHIPVIGTIFCLVFWVLVSMRRDYPGQRMVMWVIVFTALIGIAVKFTGDPAAEKLSGLDTYIKEHEDWADRATTGIFVWLSASGWGLWSLRAGGKMKMAVWLCITITGIVTMVLMGVAAYHGGRISHPEIRSGSGIQNRGAVDSVIYVQG